MRQIRRRMNGFKRKNLSEGIKHVFFLFAVPLELKIEHLRKFLRIQWLGRLRAAQG